MIRIEMPNTDAYRLLCNDQELHEFCVNHKLDAEKDLFWNQEQKLWIVPKFKHGREQYIAAKTEDCARWGCE